MTFVDKKFTSDADEAERKVKAIVDKCVEANNTFMSYHLLDFLLKYYRELFRA